MPTITITTENATVETKVNGQAVEWQLDKAHESWIELFLVKGTQRWANDKYSGSEGATKLEQIRHVAALFNSGEAVPEDMVGRGGGTAKLPDDEALALSNVKRDLTVLFKRLTGKAKIADMIAADERVGKYFTEGKNGPTWDDAAAWEWGKAQERDYLAEARAALNTDLAAIDI